jgi:hypothetical protein
MNPNNQSFWLMKLTQVLPGPREDSDSGNCWVENKTRLFQTLNPVDSVHLTWAKHQTHQLRDFLFGLPVLMPFVIIFENVNNQLAVNASNNNTTTRLATSNLG